MENGGKGGQETGKEEEKQDEEGRGDIHTTSQDAIIYGQLAYT